MYLLLHLPVGRHHELAEVSNALVWDLPLLRFWFQEIIQLPPAIYHMEVSYSVRGTGHKTSRQSTTTRFQTCVEEISHVEMLIA